MDGGYLTSREGSPIDRSFGPTSCGLGALLEPMSPDEFFTTYFSQQPVYICGRPQKYTDIMGWEDINRILRHVPSSSMRLSKAGRALPSEDLFKPYLSGSAIAEQLRDGATMLIRDVDRLYGPIGDLCERLERSFDTDVHANVYVGMCGGSGTNLHRDSHDVLVLQLEGRKHWVIYGETERFPLETSGERPDGQPVWEGTLSRGDTLYVPRGWWHIVTPCGEPTLHVTVGVYNPTAIDFLQWATECLKGRESLRMDIPRFRDVQFQGAYWYGIQQELRKFFDTPAIGQEFLNERSRSAVARPMLDMPSEILPTSARQVLLEDWVELTIPRRLVMTHEDQGEVTIQIGPKTLILSAGTEAIFDCLITDGPISVGEICCRFQDRFDQHELVALFSDLLKEGLIRFAKR